GFSSGALPGFQRTDFPIAALLLARFALQPGLRTAANEACQEVAAGLSVLSVGRGDRRHCPARTGSRIFPRHAGVFFVPALGGGRGGGEKEGGRLRGWWCVSCAAGGVG